MNRLNGKTDNRYISRCNSDGNFTVEVSIFFPIIFFCTLFLVYVALYIYNQITLQNLSQKVVMQICNLSESENTDAYLGYGRLDQACLNSIATKEFQTIYTTGTMLFVEQNPKICVEILRNGTTNREVAVSLSVTMKNPVFSGIFQRNGKIELKAYSRSLMQSEANFYRLLYYAKVKARGVFDDVYLVEDDFVDNLKSEAENISKTREYLRKE